MAAVEVEGLVKHFGATKALRGIDFEVEQSTVLGLLGPNGAGKTTAVRILTTLIKPTAGRAMVDGIDVVAQPRRVRARIGLTGQYAAVDERLTGRENLELVGRFFRMGSVNARLRAGELLERFELIDAQGRLVKTYSGGMRRRLDVAMSLIARPSVLFLDEPTTGLDPRSRLAMWDLIEELAAEGTTTLLTTQYLEEADRLATKIVVVDHGSVIARGTSDELKDRVGGDRVEAVLDPSVVETGILGSGRGLDDAVRALESIAIGRAGFDAVSHTLTIPVRSGIGVPMVVRALDDAGVSVLDAVVRRPTLDDVFLALTGHGTAEESTDA
jgi:ABC-2 type transport system ATP-binding protein